MTTQRTTLPRLLITLGDVAGVGPEVLVKAWPELTAFSRPVVVGDPFWIRRALDLLHGRHVIREIVAVQKPDDAVSSASVLSYLPQTRDLSHVQPCQVSAAAGQAAFDFLIQAIELTRAGHADAIVTLPLHKEGLAAA